MSIRKHAEANSLKARDGRAFEALMKREVENWMDQAGLQVNVTKPKPILCSLPRPGSRPFYIRPDIVITRPECDTHYLAFGGAKISFRERIYQDLFMAGLALSMFPNTIWIEQWRSEDSKQTDAQIERFITRKMDIFGGYFTLYSTMNQKSIAVARTKTIAHVTAHLSRPD